VNFTKLLKFGSALMTLVLIGNGLVRGFDLNTTVLSVVLVLVSYLLEARLLKSEREENEARIIQINHAFEELVNKLSKVQASDKEEILKKIEHTHSQLSALKMNQGIRKL
jgi:mannitol-specific phosphotransferase system IIBC component